jgi:hypothetical protein
MPTNDAGPDSGDGSLAAATRNRVNCSAADVADDPPEHVGVATDTDPGLPAGAQLLLLVGCGRAAAEGWGCGTGPVTGEGCLRESQDTSLLSTFLYSLLRRPGARGQGCELGQHKVSDREMCVGGGGGRRGWGGQQQRVG